MAAGFTRRFTFDPGLAKILEIEGVVIIDRDIPGNTTGATTGATALVAEFEDGPYNTPLEIFSGDDQLSTLGGFGFTQDGLPSSNPCARSRKADSAIRAEYWNGNGFLALSQKTFPRLFVVRADTSVGAVEFTRRAALSGSNAFSFDLEPGATAIFKTAFATSATATFNAAAALLTTGTGSYPTGFVGGESFNITIDDGTPLQIGPIDITFSANEQTQAQAITRINAVLGYAAALTSSATVFTIAGRVRGNTSSVKINSISGGTITSKLGISVTSVIGTGNVGNIDQVTFAEVKAVIEAAFASSRVDRDSAGNLRVTALAANEILYTAASTADALGFPETFSNEQPDGFAYLYSTAGTYPVTFASDTLTLGFDGDANVTVAFTNGSTAQAAVITAINAAVGFTCVTSASSTILRFNGRVNGGQVRIVAGTANALTNLGLTTQSQTAVAVADTVIPAGTRVRNASAVEWLTTQSTAVPASSSGPYAIKVRPSLDDGTIGSATSATVTTLVDPVPLASFTVTNPTGLSAALSEGALDAAYATAIDSTLDASSVAAQANFITSARMSNAIRTALRTNAGKASENLRGRTAMIRPPLGTTTRAQAKSTSAQPGVGAYRDRRVFYNYPGINLFIPQIGQRGTAGGAGFTADGFIDLGSDIWAASVAGLLPPEQNAGQETTFMSAVSGIEKGNPDVQKLTEADYVSFKASGIMAPRVADGTPIFQSDVTSFDPASGSSAIDGPTRRFADFAEDSLAAIASKYSKKPMTAKRRSDVFGEFDGFCLLLLSPGDEDSARIAGYKLDAKSGNPQAALDAGVFRIKTKIKMNSDMLDIVIDASIGKTVDVSSNV